jgi:hypothetical protein
MRPPHDFAGLSVAILEDRPPSFAVECGPRFRRTLPSPRLKRNTNRRPRRTAESKQIKGGQLGPQCTHPAGRLNRRFGSVVANLDAGLTQC